MKVKNDSKQRSSKGRQERENSKSHNHSGGLGDVSTESSESRNYQIGVTRTDSERPDLTEFAVRTETTGGILRRLTQELEEQLAYHREQTKNLEITLQRVIHLTEAENIDLIE